MKMNSLGAHILASTYYSLNNDDNYFLIYMYTYTKFYYLPIPTFVNIVCKTAQQNMLKNFFLFVSIRSRAQIT